MMVYKSIASLMGIGYIRKGAGTVASLLFCLLFYFLHTAYHYNELWLLYLSIALTPIGAWVTLQVEKSWEKDSNRIVIDEVAGMAISLLFIPISIFTLTAAFILFRFFDIVKPLYIRRAENIPYGWGVMLDDVLAGIYANLILQCIIHLFPWLWSFF